jgi:RNA polymerase sigma-70 factor (ECF subfamily)
MSLDEIWETSNWEAGQLPVYELEEKEQFQHLLKYLPPEDQQIFLKLFWDDKSYEEVSSEMKIGKSALYNRVSRGKRRLRDLLKRREENEGYI